jgi:glucokinase
LAGIVNVLDSEAVVIGGGLAQAWDLFADALEQTMRSRLYDAIAADLRLLKAECGDAAAAVGAACFALDSAGD